MEKQKIEEIKNVKKETIGYKLEDLRYIMTPIVKGELMNLNDKSDVLLTIDGKDTEVSYKDVFFHVHSVSPHEIRGNSILQIIDGKGDVDIDNSISNIAFYDKITGVHFKITEIDTAVMQDYPKKVTTEDMLKYASIFSKGKVTPKNEVVEGQGESVEDKLKKAEAEKAAEEAKIKAEAERVKAEAEAKEKADAEAKEKEEADALKAKEEADAIEAKAKEEADAAEAKAKEEADAKAKKLQEDAEEEVAKEAAIAEAKAKAIEKAKIAKDKEAAEEAVAKAKRDAKEAEEKERKLKAEMAVAAEKAKKDKEKADAEAKERADAKAKAEEMRRIKEEAAVQAKIDLIAKQPGGQEYIDLQADMKENGFKEIENKSYRFFVNREEEVRFVKLEQGSLIDFTEELNNVDEDEETKELYHAFVEDGEKKDLIYNPKEGTIRVAKATATSASAKTE